MGKIVRRPDFAGGGITKKERAQMAEHVKSWVARAFRTDPIEPDKIVPAIHALYAAAGLKQPRVVIVPSPKVMAFAGGFAAGIWYLRKKGQTLAATDAATDAATLAATDAATLAATDAATRDATWAATEDATWAATNAATLAATEEATWDATWEATNAATEDATWAATLAATDAATREATNAATRDATRDATLAATRDATLAATRDATLAATWDATLAATWDATAGIAKFLLSCADRWSFMYQGGNMWAGFDSYLSAARDILGLRLPAHEKYAAWEQCAIHGGFRIMHDEFCMVSDFPEILKVDEQNRPHCDDGPSHRWRDGWSLHHVHGVRVPAYVVERPDLITAKAIDDEKNAEVRRVMLDRFGEVRYIEESGMTPVSSDPVFGDLYVRRLDVGRPIAKICVTNRTPELDGSFKRYWLSVNPDLYDGDAGRVPQAAVASTWRTTPGGSELLFKDYHDYRPVTET